jgi:hypothetical protein
MREFRGERPAAAKGISFLLIAAIVGFTLFAASAEPQGDDAGGQGETRSPSTDRRGLLSINLDYYRLSSSTGGDFYFWAPGEFRTSGVMIPFEQEAIFLSYGVLEERDVGFAFPVEGGSLRLSVFAGAQRKDFVDVIRPDGRTLTGKEANVQFQEYRYMALVTVDRPEPGLWTLRVKGEGHYAFTVRQGPAPGARSAKIISLIDFRFVTLSGRPGHEGYVSDKGPIRAGAERTCRIVMAGPYRTAEFAFISSEGSRIAALSLSPGDPNAAEGEYIGTCRIPARPFRLLVRGVDWQGNPYQRIGAPLLVPEAEQ